MSPHLSNINFGIYILNLFSKSSYPITSATVFFRLFPYIFLVCIGVSPPSFLPGPTLNQQESKPPFLSNLSPL